MEDWEIIGTVRNVRRGDCYVLYFMVENKGNAWYNQNVKNVDKSEFVEKNNRTKEGRRRDLKGFYKYH